MREQQSLMYVRAVRIFLWLFSPAIGCHDMCPSFKTVSVYVKDESLDSTSLSSSPQFHWMIEKGMVGLIG